MLIRHIVLIALSMLLASCSSITSTALFATQTPTITATPIPSATFTATVTLTNSPTATETATPVPTETATPIPEVQSDQWMVEATQSPETSFTYVFPIKDAKVGYGASHHDYPATDIFCDEGSTFVAVTDGVVEFVSAEDSWSPKNDDPALRSGIAVAIIGLDGVRYYGSHLSSVAEGVTPGLSVKAGDVLGYTGKSGNARSTPPHLHFGISRPSFPTDWRVRRGEMNPYQFLQAWQRGESLQPSFGDQ